jgi:hypothetical protein
MSKDPQDRNRVPGQGEGEGEDMEKMPRKDLGEQKKDQQKGGEGGQQNWNKEEGQTGQQGGQKQQGDPMNPPKDTDEEETDDRKRRPA